MRKLTRALLSLVPIAGLVVTAACTRAQAKVAPVEPPFLDVPAPPPRDIEPIVAETAPKVGPIEEPQRSIPETTANPRPPQRSGPSRPDAQKPDSQAEAKPEAPARGQSATVLQTIPAEKEGELERSIRVQLGRAVGNLSRVDYRVLSGDGKANYDQARRFISQAEEALSAKNLVFAGTVAEKADTLAAQLAGQ
jgi:hypothetical protein